MAPSTLPSSVDRLDYNLIPDDVRRRISGMILRQARKRAGRTVGQMRRTFSVSQNFISMVEHGHRAPPQAMIAKMAARYKLTAIQTGALLFLSPTTGSIHGLLKHILEHAISPQWTEMYLADIDAYVLKQWKDLDLMKYLSAKPQ